MVCDNEALVDAMTRAFEAGAGDFTVVVETDDGTAVAAFKVWSGLLSSWSEVIAAMLSHAEMEEAQNRELRLRGFTKAAVEKFLRFLYTGKLTAEPSVLIEVAALADKYNVVGLAEKVVQCAAKLITPQNACDLLHLALRLGVSQVIDTAMEKLFREAHVSLRKAYMLPVALLDDILSSEHLRIGGYDLATLFVAWAKDAKAQQHIASSDLRRLFEQHVHLAALTGSQRADLISAASETGLVAEVDAVCKAAAQGARTEDFFESLWDEYCDTHAGRKPAFLGYWVNVIPSDPTILTRSRSQLGRYKTMESFAAGQEALELFSGESVTWFMPHHCILISGVSFQLNSDSDWSARFTWRCGDPSKMPLRKVAVLISRNGRDWQCILDLEEDRAGDDGVVMCRTKELANWICLLARDRFLARLRVHGVFVGEP